MPGSRLDGQAQDRLQENTATEGSHRSRGEGWPEDGNNEENPAEGKTGWEILPTSSWCATLQDDLP